MASTWPAAWCTADTRQVIAGWHLSNCDSEVSEVITGISARSSRTPRLSCAESGCLFFNLQTDANNSPRHRLCVFMNIHKEIWWNLGRHVLLEASRCLVPRTSNSGDVVPKDVNAAVATIKTKRSMDHSKTRDSWLEQVVWKRHVSTIRKH